MSAVVPATASTASAPGPASAKATHPALNRSLAAKWRDDTTHETRRATSHGVWHADRSPLG